MIKGAQPGGLTPTEERVLTRYLNAGAKAQAGLCGIPTNLLYSSSSAVKRARHIAAILAERGADIHRCSASLRAFIG
jgi:hypothetical protein